MKRIMPAIAGLAALLALLYFSAATSPSLGGFVVVLAAVALMAALSFWLPLGWCGALLLGGVGLFGSAAGGETVVYAVSGVIGLAGGIYQLFFCGRQEG